MKKPIPLLIAFALMAAACGDDTTDTTSTTTQATTTTQPTTTTTSQAGLEEKMRVDVATVLEGSSCNVLNDYVVTDAAYDGQTDPDLLPTTVVEILEATSEPRAWPATLENDDAIGVNVYVDIAFWELQNSIDPLDKVGALWAAGQKAAPINLVAPVGHWSWEPGEPATVISTTATLPNPSPSVSVINDNPSVAVIDTGLAITGQDWIDAHALGDDEGFAPQGDPSHGTFVTSVIRQVAPEHRVQMFRPNVIDKSVVKWDDGGQLTVETTSEIQVLAEIERAAEEMGEDAQVLNLSIGTYPCNIEENPPPDQADFSLVATIRSSIDKWIAVTDAPVIAAAGNELLDLDFYPAALQSVTGVGATGLTTEGAGLVISWDDNGVRVKTSPQNHASWLAPGEDLVSYSEMNQVASWGGTSFATAVVSGLVAAGAQIPSSSTQASTDYDTVKGLSFLQSGVVTTTP